MTRRPAPRPASRPRAKPARRAWRPSPPALVATFERATARLPGIERRKMFGYPAVFARGRMVAGLMRERMVMRLAEPERTRFLAQPGAIPFVAMGRTMREWVVIPRAVLASPRALAGWLAKALAQTRALPPKPARGARRRR